MESLDVFHGGIAKVWILRAHQTYDCADFSTLQHIVEYISRLTAGILANKHSKGSVFLRSFDRIYCINYTIFVHTQLSIY